MLTGATKNKEEEEKLATASALSVLAQPLIGSSLEAKISDFQQPAFRILGTRKMRVNIFGTLINETSGCHVCVYMFPCIQAAQNSEMFPIFTLT